MPFQFPKLYPILDSSCIPSADRSHFLHDLGIALADAGVTLLEYRNKTGSDAEILSDASILRAALPAPNIKLILDDRADLIDKADFDGAHVDAGDLTPTHARQLLGPDRILGTYGGTESLLPGILLAPCDYFSIGPIFPTVTKQTTKAPIGTEGVRQLRSEAGPDSILVAVGGVTLDTALSVLGAGANTIAVSAAIFRTPDPAAEFRKWMRALA